MLNGIYLECFVGGFILEIRTRFKTNMSNRLLYILQVMLLTCFMLLISEYTVFADKGLKEALQSSAFRGSFEVLKSLSIFGVAMTWIITAFGFMGTWFTIFRKAVTTLYLGGRNIFDMIDDLQQSHGGGTLTKDVFKGIASSGGKYGKASGADSLIHFVLGFCPNIKRWSDYSPDVREYNLKEDDTIIQYWTKTLMPTVFLLLFYISMWNGSLINVYLMLTDAGSAVVDQVANSNLDKYVTVMLTSGEHHEFTLGADGSAKGSLTGDVAESVYKKAVGMYEITDTINREKVGSAVEEKLKSLDRATVISSYLPQGTDWSKISTADNDKAFWKNLKYDVSYSKADLSGARVLEIKAQDIGIANAGIDDKFYVTFSMGNLDIDNVFLK